MRHPHAAAVGDVDVAACVDGQLERAGDRRPGRRAAISRDAAERELAVPRDRRDLVVAGNAERAVAAATATIAAPTSAALNESFIRKPQLLLSEGNFTIPHVALAVNDFFEQGTSFERPRSMRRSMAGPRASRRH